MKATPEFFSHPAPPKSGPRGTCCISCSFIAPDDGVSDDAKCNKVRVLFGVEPGTISSRSASCRYYERKAGWPG
jgi:hypothetical protein